jgi:NAD-dependent deacetylase
VRHDALKYVVDPRLPDMPARPYLKMIQDKASTGMETVRKELLEWIK